MLSSVSIFGQGEVKIEKLIENNFIHYFEDVIKTNKADYIIYYNADNYPECYQYINKVNNRINIRTLSFDMY